MKYDLTGHGGFAGGDGTVVENNRLARLGKRRKTTADEMVHHASTHTRCK